MILRRMWLGMLTLGLLVTSPHSAAHADFDTKSLQELVCSADVVFVGKATRFVNVRVTKTSDSWLDLPVTDSFEAKLALVSVEQVLRGKLKSVSVWVWATFITVSDLTEIVVGERAVFSLFSKSVEDQLIAESRKRLIRATNGTTLHHVAWEGRGQMPIRTIAGVEYARVWTGNIALPLELVTVPSDSPFSRGFVRFVRLDELCKAIKQIRTVETIPALKNAEPIVKILKEIAFGTYDQRENAQEALGDYYEHLPAITHAYVSRPRSPLWTQAVRIAINYLNWDQLDGVPRIRSMLASSSPGHRHLLRAIEMGTRLELEAVKHPTQDVLRTIGKDADPFIRSCALAAIASRVDPHEGKVFSALSEALADDSLFVRQWATFWVAEIPRSFFTEVKFAPVWREIEGRLVAMTKHKDLASRRAAWEGLGRASSNASWPQIKLAVGNPDPFIRAGAIAALAGVRSDASIKIRVDLLTSDDPWTRLAAIESLRQSKSVKAAEALAELAGHSHGGTVFKAMYALGEMGPAASKALPILRKWYKARRDDPMDNHLRIGSAIDSLTEDEPEVAEAKKPGVDAEK